MSGSDQFTPSSSPVLPGTYGMANPAGLIDNSNVRKVLPQGAEPWKEWNDSVDWYDANTGKIVDHAGDGKHYNDMVAGEAAKAVPEPESEAAPAPAVYLEENDVPREGAGRAVDFREVAVGLNSRYSMLRELFR